MRRWWLIPECKLNKWKWNYMYIMKFNIGNERTWENISKMCDLFIHHNYDSVANGVRSSPALRSCKKFRTHPASKGKRPSDGDPDCSNSVSYLKPVLVAVKIILGSFWISAASVAWSLIALCSLFKWKCRHHVEFTGCSSEGVCGHFYRL